MKKPTRTRVDRRVFVKTAGSAAAATAGMILVSPRIAFGSEANSALQLGMIGCGGRGSSVADSFVTRGGGVRVAALADVLQDQLERARTRFDRVNEAQGHAKIDASRLYKGAESFRELCRSELDIVLISTPPYYHPEHLEAAVEAGKHIYLEKPVATDVRGCRIVAALAQKVDGKQSVHVGFQIRYSPEYREMVRRIHEGAIGEIASVQGYYLAGDLPRRAKPGMPREEARIRDWFFERVLSGDVLVEQNIHILDWINWVLKSRPESAVACAGRKVRRDVGDVSDHFVTIYRYPGNVYAGFQSTQFLPKWSDVCVRFLGSKGYAEAHYTGGVFIAGENEWRAEAPAASSGQQRPEIDPLREATPEKAAAFVRSIRSGEYHNELRQGADSTLSAILGREAAYKGKEMRWDRLMRSNQRWRSDLDLSKLPA